MTDRMSARPVASGNPGDPHPDRRSRRFVNGHGKGASGANGVSGIHDPDGRGELPSSSGHGGGSPDGDGMRRGGLSPTEYLAARDVSAPTTVFGGHRPPASAPFEELPPDAGFGLRLAAERERQGLTVGDVAGLLRLHPNQVKALEAANLGALPAAPYVRGFVRNYARALGIDPQPLLDDLQSRLAPPPPTLDALTGPAVQPGAVRLSRKPAGAQWADGTDAGARRTVLVVAVAALVVFAALGWYTTRKPAAPSVSIGPVSSDPAPGPVAAPVDAPGASGGAGGAGGSAGEGAGASSGSAQVDATAGPGGARALPGDASGTGGAGPVPGAPAGVASPQPAGSAPAAGSLAAAASPVPAAPASNAAPPPAASGAIPAPADGLLLRFSQLVWVQVTGPDGRVVLSQNNAAGSEQLLPGAGGPYRLTIGNADGAVLVWRGKPVDLRPYTNENVARLTLE